MARTKLCYPIHCAISSDILSVPILIPSGLCNSRRHRQCPASRVSVKNTPEPRSSILQGVRLHNPDYVKLAPSVSCGRPTFELPGDAPPGCSGPPSRTSGLQARQGAQHFARLRRTGIKIPAPLQQSSPGTSPRRPLPPLLSSLRRQWVCVGAKCNAFDRH